MATFPALLETLAPYDGRTVATLNVVGGHLRSAGLVHVGSRGRGGIHVSADDAAALVLASLWTDSPSASPRAVEMLRTLKRRPALVDASLPRCLGLVIRLPDFGEAIAALIEFAHILEKETSDFSLELTVMRPVPAASLELVDFLGRRRLIAEWMVDADRLTKGFYLPEARQRADRRHSTAITGKTLFALGELVRRETAEVAA